MDEKLNLLSKYSFTEEKAVQKGINLAEISVEELEVALAGFEAEQEEDQGASQETFEAEAEVIEVAEDEVAEDFEAETEVDAVAADAEIDAEVETVEVEVDFAAKEQEYLSRITALEESLNSVSQEREALIVERDELAEFKKQKVKEQHQADVEELFAKFNSLTDEDIAEVKEQMFDLTLEQVQEKLFTILGKKAVSGTFSFNAKKKESVKIDLDVSERKENQGYALEHLFERYADK